MLLHPTSAKWYLWHGNVEQGLELIEDCYIVCYDENIKYNKQKKFLKYLDELSTYIENNRQLIPNYGKNIDMEKLLLAALLNQQ